MVGEKAGSLLWQIRMLVAAEHTRRLTDRELLEHFARERDEAAFAALVQRHGPMVLRVCRGVLGHEQDAEDAFQAAFLVLARKVATLRWQESIASWLYEVARRLAQEAKAKVLKRQVREGLAGLRQAADPLAGITGRELLEALDEELLRLSEPYRAPLVLCCLEGKSGDEAARQLGCSLSTLKRRLSRARRLLQARLKRRGIALRAAAVATLLLHSAASATLTPGISQSTARAAVLYAAGGNVAGAVSAQAVALSEALLKGLFLTNFVTKWKLGVALLAVCLVGGASLWAHQALGVREANDRHEEDPPVVTLEEPAARETGRRSETALVKEEHFDRDPGWEGFNNRVAPKRIPTVTQGFGFSPTNFAGQEKGEIGGLVTRSTTPAHYADKIAIKTLNDKLSASGTFALTASSGNSAVFFGWFNAAQPGGGRPLNSLGLYLEGEKDREGKGARLAVRLIASTNRSCETYVTPYIAGQHRPTPIRTDGTRYTWTLGYEPEANDGNGRFQFTIQSNPLTLPSPPLVGGEGRVRGPEDFEGKTFSVDLPAGFKQEGATFDRFGLMNLMKPGNVMTIYFDDLLYDGKTEDFAQDPFTLPSPPAGGEGRVKRGWEASGNHATFPDPFQAGAHDFGFSATTNFAGGAPGEIGGTFWRTGTGYGYYADRVGPLTLADRLEARGRVVLKVGAPESDMYLGWFDSAAKDKPPTEAGHFLGVHLGGPTRVGHYFRPTYTTAKGTRGEPKMGPVLVPDKVYEWTLLYDPTANGGNGAMRVTLGQESVTLPLRKGHKAEEAHFDRFGLFSSSPGGSLLKVYFDDLKYTQVAEVKATLSR